jgi:osmotically-inducible protein OsmY
MMVEYSEVAKRVRTALANDERTREFGIDVVDDNGLVTLRGTVTSRETRQTAEQIAREQKGVIDVINDLQVQSDEVGRVVIPTPPKH